jgi:hypothetical protein
MLRVCFALLCVLCFVVLCVCFSFLFLFVSCRTFSISVPGDLSVAPWYRPSSLSSAKYMEVLFTLAVDDALAAVPGDAFSWKDQQVFGVKGQVQLPLFKMFWLTGVQLERGVVATPFDVRSSEASLRLDQLAQSSPAFKNRVFNGDMSVETPLPTATVTSSGQTVLDGWQLIYTTGTYKVAATPHKQLQRNTHASAVRTALRSTACTSLLLPLC